MAKLALGKQTLKFFGFILPIVLLTTAILFVVINNSRQQVTSDYNLLETSVRNLFALDEYLYNDIKNSEKQEAIVARVNDLRQQLQITAVQHIAMGRLIPLQAYCELHRFIAWNDKLQSENGRIKLSQLKSPKDINKWRDTVLEQLYIGDKLHSGIFQALKDYIFNPRINKYDSADC